MAPVSRPSLSILGIGVELPPAVDVRELAASKGADTSEYDGWDRVCRARPDDHPSTMASAAFGRALQESGVSANEIGLLIFSGVSRDYPPSWSVATEVMRMHAMSEGCVGLDLTIGCLGTLAALELAMGWLSLRGGGYAAVVTAERWSHTVDLADPAVGAMWAWADGGGALVVAMGSDRPALAEFLGAELTSASGNNGHLLIPYGGTRQPLAPEGVDPFLRVVSDRDRRAVIDSYLYGYQSAYRRLVERLGVRGERLICNQITQGMVAMIANGLGFSMDQVVVTGHDTGHTGGADAIIGLRHLIDRGELSAPTAIGASTPYAFGAAIVVPPTDRPAD